MNTSCCARSRLGVHAFCCALIVGLGSLLAFNQQARANVFAAHLETSATSWNFQSGPITFSYRLNQPATSVNIEIYRAADPNTVIRTITNCPTARGLNQVSWDGTDDLGNQVPAGNDYKFRVIAVDAIGNTSGTWVDITPKPDGVNEIGDAQFGAPQGITINREPTSAHFGRIYISNSASTASTNPGATAAGDGLFLLNNDLTFRGGSASTAAAAANSSLVTSTTTSDVLSPWKCNINQDNPNEIVVSDYLDGYENVWVFNADGTEVQRLLNSSTTGPSTGAAANHGNQFCTLLSGIGTGRKLWAIDEDKDAGGTRFTGGYDLLRYDVGTTLSNYTGQPAEVKNGGTTHTNPTVTNFYSGWDMQFGRVKGTSRLYVACRRGNATTGNLAMVCWTLDGNGNLTGALWSVQNPALSVPAGLPDNYAEGWNYTSSIAVDEARGRGAVVSARVAKVLIFNTETGAIIGPAFTVGNGSTTSYRGIDADFDAAGNLYTANANDGHVRVWSPPDGPNSYTTPYSGTMLLNCPYATPTILVQPVSGKTCEGRSFTFSVVAEGHGAELTYQWKRGSTVVGTNSPTLTLSSVTAADAGNYTVTVNGCGSVTSSVATLTVVANCIPDYNGDNLVNQSDWVLWEACATGPDVPASSECLSASPPKDLDFDGDVDQDDFGIFQKCLNGEYEPDPACVR
ncbi:MAG TPA: FlgD immunoglobulin-like domain containing protein [Phycisphaerae bacterium]|nr:hypothetical protein [Phycisphaerae bacterium]HOB75885.1 FlgD immunoglobulin-like domain containing protein [Phycisphaerae bacterium]HPP20781.1 FlgD immunoglobulin-like domain containing protein [Phycisphaerae bacterium]HPU33376.1 FlgD immunoglobulin-like domain containing protein [Phycisphaerae bacterium]HQA45065.1 FlgD immunoglobulin-like domain containing protein [Phycisphaerae bacterium]